MPLLVAALALAGAGAGIAGGLVRPRPGPLHTAEALVVVRAAETSGSRPILAGSARTDAFVATIRQLLASRDLREEAVRRAGGGPPVKVTGGRSRLVVRLSASAADPAAAERAVAAFVPLAAERLAGWLGADPGSLGVHLGEPATVPAGRRGRGPELAAAAAGGLVLGAAGGALAGAAAGRRRRLEEACGRPVLDVDQAAAALAAGRLGGAGPVSVVAFRPASARRVAALLRRRGVDARPVAAAAGDDRDGHGAGGCYRVLVVDARLSSGAAAVVAGDLDAVALVEPGRRGRR